VSTAQTILGVVGALVVLATAGGGLWAVFRSSAQDATIKRLRDERDDYLSRLNFIEPRHRAVEQQNEVLLALHNPTERLDDLGSQHAEMLRLLNAQSILLQQIDRTLDRPRGGAE
jgi:hypothetical protein